MSDDSIIKDYFINKKSSFSMFNDIEVIQSCKKERSRDVIDNARLGSYDKFGNYVFLPDVKYELIRLPKIIINTSFNQKEVVYDLKGNIPIFGDMFFKLIIKNSEAVLKIVETVKRKSNNYVETYYETIEAFATGIDGLPLDIIFNNFNIKETPDDFGKQQEKYDYNNILTRKVYLSLLSKSLNDVANFNERMSFKKMTDELKNSGEYGLRVLKDFINKSQDNNSLLESNNEYKKNKAKNDLLLSALDSATTHEDKINFLNNRTYNLVKNIRDDELEQFIDEAQSRVDEKYVNSIVKKSTIDFNENKDEKESEEVADFLDKISDKESNRNKRELTKPILKQGKEEIKNQNQSKEDKIKDILNKKNQNNKKTSANKKLKPLKSNKLKNKKLKSKKNVKKKRKVNKPKLKSKKKKLKKAKNPKKIKGSKFKKKSKKIGKKRKLGKAKLKNKKKKMKKAKAPAKVKAQGGGKIKPSSGAKKSAKKAKKGGFDYSLLLAKDLEKSMFKPNNPITPIKNLSSQLKINNLKVSPVKNQNVEKNKQVLVEKNKIEVNSNESNLDNALKLSNLKTGLENPIKSVHQERPESQFSSTINVQQPSNTLFQNHNLTSQQPINVNSNLNTNVEASIYNNPSTVFNSLENINLKPSLNNTVLPQQEATIKSFDLTHVEPSMEPTNFNGN